MRNSSEYSAKAAEFERLASEVANNVLKQRYADLAKCYRLLADDRERLIGEGVIAPDDRPCAP